jgi:hypothetical protein
MNEGKKNSVPIVPKALSLRTRPGWPHVASQGSDASLLARPSRVAQLTALLHRIAQLASLGSQTLLQKTIDGWMRGPLTSHPHGVTEPRLRRRDRLCC